MFKKIKISLAFLIILFFLTILSINITTRITLNSVNTIKFDYNYQKYKNISVDFKIFYDGRYHRNEEDPYGNHCPVTWKYVDNLEESDLIGFGVLDHMKILNHIEKFKYDKNRQKIFVMSMETPYYGRGRYKALLTKREYFDFVLDYHLDSDVPLIYTYSFFNFSTPALPTKEKGQNGRGLVAAFISNCKATNERLKYLKKLKKYIDIDSYGKCVHNKDIYEEDKVDFEKEHLDLLRTPTHVEKTNIIRKYKFTLSFENCNDRDYVTEKFFQPLEVGSVPIFYGTPNIADFAPKHSYINVNDFESPKALADYLKYLDQNDEAYESYLEWKKRAAVGDFDENFKRLIELGKIDHTCHLLKRIKNLWINPYLKEWDRKDVPKEERACRYC